MMILRYRTKAELKAAIGRPLLYTETSLFGEEFRPNGKIVGCNRPHITGYSREFFAEVTMKDGLIAKVA